MNTADQTASEISLHDFVEKALLQYHTPTCVIVNSKGEMLYTHGRTGKYLEPASGEASLNILGMAREGLQLELAIALRKCLTTRQAVDCLGLQVKTNGEYQTINLTVSPVIEPASMQGLMMVLFEDVNALTKGETHETILTEAVTDKDRRIIELERELRDKEEYLQTTIKDLETSNEELKSTNEELETSKEELQSVNEELTTVNTEHQIKIDELFSAKNDMVNLLAGTGVGTIFLDQQLNIQRFTPPATQVINLIQTDVGRPINHISPNFIGYDQFDTDAQEVLDTMIPKEIELQMQAGPWYLTRILPYRTVENVIEGVVITFTDVSAIKTAQMELRASEEQLSRLLDSGQDVITQIDLDGRYLFYSGPDQFGLETKDVVGKKIAVLFPPEFADSILSQIQEVADDGVDKTWETQIEWQGEQMYFLDYRYPIVNTEGEITSVGTIGRNVTPLIEANLKLQESEQRFRLAADQAGMIFAQVDLDLRYTWIYNPHPDFDPSAVLGKRDSEVADNEGTRKLAQLKQQVIDTQKKQYQEIKFPLSDGDKIFAIYAEPLLDADGQMIGVTTYSTDITTVPPGNST